MVRTQAELAEIVGYSRVTVSKALSGHPSVQASTRERILEKAREVGYRPNAAARQMRCGRFNAAALLLSSEACHDYMPCGLYRGLQRGLAEHDLMMTVAEVADYGFDATRNGAPRIIREMTADGLLVDFRAAADQAVIERVDELTVPAVWLNLKLDRDAVYIDDVDGGRKAAEHLLRAGHTRIAYLGTSGMQRHYSVADRYVGYADAMTAAGHSPVNLVPDKQDVGNAERYKRTRAILASSDRPTAIVAYERCELNVVTTLAAELGLKLGRDLSLVVMTDEMHKLYEAPVTMMRIPFEQTGRRAVEALVQRIDASGEHVESVAVPYESIVEGTTVGPPAA